MSLNISPRATELTAGLSVLPFGLGTNTFGMTTDAAASESVLDAFVEGGGTLLDTADMYSFWVPGNSGGESETVIGEWMRKRGNRSDVVVATKVSGLPAFPGLSPKNIAAAADASLQRLQTDYIDIYFAHYEDADTSIADTAAAFDALVRAGKVRHIAASNLQPAKISEWISFAKENDLATPMALQPNYSLVARAEYENSYGPLAQQHGLSVLTYSSLANGFLSGKYRSEEDLAGRPRGQAAREFLTSEGLGVLNALDSVAKNHEVSVATTALAWLLAQPTVSAPLASATSPEQLSELMAAVRVDLTAEEVDSLNRASAPFA